MKYTRNNNIYTKKINNRWYILEKNKKTMRELNEVAGFVWELLVKACSFENLVNKVCKEYEVTPEVAEKDIQKFISEYVQEGYISTVSDQLE
jgi:hypothetical protein